MQENGGLNPVFFKMILVLKFQVSLKKSDFVDSKFLFLAFSGD